MSQPRDTDSPVPVPPWQAVATSVQGRARSENQDSFALLPEAGVFVVADGMGGHADGGIASRAIVEIVRRVADPAVDLRAQTALIEEALQSINLALHAEGESRIIPQVIGSTVVAVVLRDNVAVCLWAGDSRIYLLRDGNLLQLSSDHTLNVEADVQGPAGQVLTRAVGSQATLALDRLVVELRLGETLLLCSDGLTKVVADDELRPLLAEPLDGLPERLVARAIANAGTDDITVLVIRYVAPMAFGPKLTGVAP